MAKRPVVLPVPEGQVVSSGIRGARGELVFYGVKIDIRQLPGIKFGIMAGLRGPGGGLAAEVESNETSGSATAAGFHAVEAPARVGSPAVAVPEFGYYAGPAATITGLSGGRLVRAHLARWSSNPGIVIFWFPATAGTGTGVTGLTAYGTAGHPLPAGHPTPPTANPLQPSDHSGVLPAVRAEHSGEAADADRRRRRHRSPGSSAREAPQRPYLASPHRRISDCTYQ